MYYSTICDISQKIISDTHSKEMLFIGEYLHSNQQIQFYVNELVVKLAMNSDFRIFAKESVYCLHPILESKSANCINSNHIANSIIEYNKAISEDKRIIVTSIDMAHSIKYSPQLVKNCLEAIIARNTNDDFNSVIKEILKDLEQLDSNEKKEEFIQKLSRNIAEYKNELDPEIYDELKFYGDLLYHSLIRKDPQNEYEYKKQADLRNEWFIKTVLRALKRTKKYNSKMICYVGAPHAYKNYLNKDDYYVGTVPEAKFFNESEIPGKVHSILIRPFYRDYFGNKTDRILNKIEKAAYRKIGLNQSIYVDLNEFKNRNERLEDVGYYNLNNTQYDGIIYLKERNV